MKKIALLAISTMLLITGCGKKNSADLMKKFEDSVLNTKSYTLKGNMEILSNEETYTYSLEANYLKDNYYKVTLINETNNHEQIILRNDDGVYVVTPSLNKSFKFQSEWPDSSSQTYILSSLLKDMKNDSDCKIEKQDDGYVAKSKVDYPNNSELTYQKIYFDKDMNLEKVEVYNNEDTICIKATFSSLNLKAKLEKEDFALEDLIDPSINEEKPNSSNSNTNSNSNNSNSNSNSQTNSNSNNSSNNNSTTKPNSTPNTSNTDNSSKYSINDPKNNKECAGAECDTKTSILDSIIYPLYIPSETYLSNSEKVDTDDGNRVILTFAGDKNFVLIEEVATVSNEFEIIPVYGDPIMLSDTIAAKSANSMYWTSNNVSYYLTSNDLSTSEMVTIAESLGNITTVSVGK